MKKHVSNLVRKKMKLLIEIRQAAEFAALQITILNIKNVVQNFQHTVKQKRNVYVFRYIKKMAGNVYLILVLPVQPRKMMSA